jgi:predicted transcriptional regulator
VFLIRAATSELRHAELHAALEGRRVRDVVATVPTVDGADADGLPAVQLDDDLHTLIEAFQGEHHHVRVLDDRMEVGLLSEADVARLIASSGADVSPR